MSAKSAYGAVLGLGGYCQVAHQLGLAGLGAGSSPFDWLVTPIDSVERVLAERGAGFFRKATRFDNGLNGGRHVLCEHYQIASVHDFPLDEAEQPDMAPQRLEGVREKLLHKTQSFLDACRAPGRKLFVRLGGSTHRINSWPYLRDDAPTRFSSLSTLCARLETICTDGFDLMFVTYERVTRFVEDAPPPGQVLFRTLPMPLDKTWEGSPEIWARLLSDGPLATASRGVSAEDAR